MPSHPLLCCAIALSVSLLGAARVVIPGLHQGDDPEARAAWEELVERHRTAAALDIVATVERRVVQFTATRAGTVAVAPRATEFLVEGESHLAHPAAGWLRTSTIRLEGEGARDSGEQDPNLAGEPQIEGDPTLPAPKLEAAPVELFELVGDGQAIHEINRRTRRIANLGTRWFAVFPDLSLVKAWTGLSLPTPRSVAFVDDPTGARRRGLRITWGTPEGGQAHTIETLWLDDAGNPLAAESQRRGPDHRVHSKFTFRSWRLWAEVDPEQYIKKPPMGFDDWDVFGESEAASLLPLGSQVPDVTLRAMGADGEDLTLASLRGQALLLTFWFVDCPGCGNDLPRVQALWEEFSAGRDDLRFLGIALCEEVSGPASYWKAMGCTYPTYRQQSDEVSRAFGVRRYPTTYVIDKDGRVLWRSAGLEEATVRAILRATR